MNLQRASRWLQYPRGVSKKWSMLLLFLVQTFLLLTFFPILQPGAWTETSRSWCSCHWDHIKSNSKFIYFVKIFYLNEYNNYIAGRVRRFSWLSCGCHRSKMSTIRDSLFLLKCQTSWSKESSKINISPFCHCKYWSATLNFVFVLPSGICKPKKKKKNSWKLDRS